MSRPITLVVSLSTTDETHVVLGIPTYNDAETIGDTLECIAAQTRRPDLVLLCDKSDDNTQKTAQDVAKKYDLPLEVISQESDGVAGAYNELLGRIERSYDIFLTLQSDLTVDEDWVETHLKVHNEYPKVDMVNGTIQDAPREDGFKEPTDPSYYLGRNFSVKSGVLEAIDGWDENFLRGEDWDMRIRLAGANTTVYSTTDVGYRWQCQDPYITLSKARRRPTVASFLAKYGQWYLWFHPSHFVSDGLSVAAVILSIVGLICLPVLPFVGALSLSATLVVVGLYTALHNLLRGSVDGKHFVGPIRKQFLNGIAVLYAIKRIRNSDTEWNMTGFNPDNIPRYKF